MSGALRAVLKPVVTLGGAGLWEKYTLTIEEAARYFRVGEGKLRRLAEQVPTPEWVIVNGNRVQIKRKKFEQFIDAIDVI